MEYNNKNYWRPTERQTKKMQDEPGNWWRNFIRNTVQSNGSGSDGDDGYGAATTAKTNHMEKIVGVYFVENHKFLRWHKHIDVRYEKNKENNAELLET